MLKIECKEATMKINVSTLTGQRFDEEIKNSTTVEDLKQRIARTQNVSFDQLRLLFNGTPLTDNKRTVASYNITDGGTIHLVMDNKVRIKVTVNMPDGKSAVYTVDSNEQVEKFKQQIQDATGMKLQNIELEFEGKAVLSGRLQHYHIRDGSKLQLKLKRIQVTVTTLDHKRLTMDVSHSETVDQFKTRLHRETGVPVPQQRLICNGRELNFGLMVDYSIQTGSTINMVGRLRGG